MFRSQLVEIIEGTVLELQIAHQIVTKNISVKLLGANERHHHYAVLLRKHRFLKFWQKTSFELIEKNKASCESRESNPGPILGKDRF